MNTDFQNDIPKELIRTAYSYTSHDPEKLGESSLSGYVSTLQQDYAKLSEYADTDEKKALLETEFPTYRARYAAYFIKALQSESRCMNWFIVGPANFPTARAEKHRRWTNARWKEMWAFRERALSAIKKKLCPELRPIMSGDKDATTRLKKEIEQAEAMQAKFKEIFQTIRSKAKEGKEVLKASLLGIGLTEEQAETWLNPGFYNEAGVLKVRLTNGSANIRRMKGRLEAITRNQAKPEVEFQGPLARVVDCPPENRVRVFFPGKPSKEVCATMKARGFRWTPSLGCWQAYRHAWTISFAKEAAGLTASEE